MWFKRKKKEPANNLPSLLKKECVHKYRDFDWYALYKYDGETKEYQIEIFEPYVCILCKHREDRLLERIKGVRDRKDFDKLYEETFRIYPKLKPLALVEDEINDMLMVDQYYLDAYFKLHPGKKPSIPNYK